MTPDFAALARRLIDTNVYMTLATADVSGRPWASPVFYAAEAYTRFLWVSAPEALHSRNIAARPQVGIVIFDSRASIGAAQAVYASCHAEQLTGTEAAEALELYSRVSEDRVARVWAPEDIREPATLRLYRAVAQAQSVLDSLGDSEGGDRRVPVSLQPIVRGQA
jgi:uncharacterized protein YhbP (UPF0306 family)